ncbi:MAG: nitroreductase family protein [Chloroflexi bacterium]|nr:nitroreductase family protein [Chloroflexota bacterium]
MEVFDCIRTRLTVRSFKPDPVPDEVVHRLLQAAQWAPSSRNLQPWHFIVIRNRDTLRQIGGIATSGRFVADAPMAIAIAMRNADRPELDAGRALQQMELVAWSEGLGTCFVGLRDAEQNRKVRQLLGVPDDMTLITVLPFGYRASSARAIGRKRRKPLSEITHAEKFGQSYGNLRASA